MASKAQLKAEIDALDDSRLEMLHRILTLLRAPPPPQTNTAALHTNPLKDSVLFEADLLSPIEETWDAER